MRGILRAAAALALGIMIGAAGLAIAGGDLTYETFWFDSGGSTPSLGLSSGAKFLWSSGTSGRDAKDTGLERTAAATLWVTDGASSPANGKLRAASAGPTAAQQHTFPAVSADTIALLAATQTLTNKTLTSPTITAPTISGSTSVTGGTFTTPTIVSPTTRYQYAPKTATFTTVAADSGTVYSNLGASATVTANLIAAPAVGTTYTFVRLASQGFRIKPGANDALYRATGAKMTDNKFLEMDADGALLTVVANDAGDWIILTERGTLVQEP